MALYSVEEIMCRPAAQRPVLLEGRWLDLSEASALGAWGPISVLEGEATGIAELPAWLTWHSQRYPAGAAIGFLGYELARVFEPLPLPAFGSWSDFSFAFYPRVERAFRSDVSVPSTPQSRDIPLQVNFKPRNFYAVVDEVRDYLAAGDIYQANLTQQFRVHRSASSAEGIYNRLSVAGAPFRAFLKLPGLTIISNSPERFFRVSAGRIVASPIKGTMMRPRQRSADAQAISRLLGSAKDRAENVMIVDLLRNDLGRVCRYGSIEARLFEIEALPHLFHLVSHVSGILRSGTGLLELLRALFPCGSITGAPKIRAMEILAKIEKVPRGISTGAIGIIRGDPASPDCEMDFNVAIRTLAIRKDAATFNVGSGITYDSSAEGEYAEMMLKAAPLLEALDVPANVLPAGAEADKAAVDETTSVSTSFVSSVPG